MQIWQKNLQHVNSWLTTRAGQQLKALELPILLQHMQLLQETSEKTRVLIYNSKHYLPLSLNIQESIKISGHMEENTDIVAAPFALPFCEEFADIIVLPYVLECLSDIYPVILECRRVLKPQGMVIFSGFNKCGWLHQYFVKQPPFNELAFFTPPELQRAWSRRGFALLQRTKFSFVGLEQGIHPLCERLGRYIWPYFANGFIMTMQKRVTPLTPTLHKFSWNRDTLPIKNSQLVTRITE